MQKFNKKYILYAAIITLILTFGFKIIHIYKQEELKGKIVEEFFNKDFLLCKQNQQFYLINNDTWDKLKENWFTNKKTGHLVDIKTCSPYKIKESNTSYPYFCNTVFLNPSSNEWIYSSNQTAFNYFTGEFFHLKNCKVQK